MKYKNSFVMYKTWRPFFETLTDSQAAELIRAIFARQDGEEYELEDVALKAIFNMISETFEEADGKYKETCERNARNRTSRDESSPVVTSRDQSSPVVHDNDSDNDSDSDSDSDNGFESEKEVLSVSTETDCQPEADAKEVVERWNTLGVCPVERVAMSSKRGQMLRARIKEYGIDKVLDAIDNVRESEYLRGQNKSGWTITFDWFVKPNNFIKVLEGQYKSRGKPTSGSAYIDAINNRFDVVDEWLASKEAT